MMKLTTVQAAYSEYCDRWTANYRFEDGDREVFVHGCWSGGASSDRRRGEAQKIADGVYDGGGLDGCLEYQIVSRAVAPA
jgi:hypothetical protein